jgi:hypothetical protein
MNQFDHLIPGSIVKLMNLDLVEMDLNLIATQANNQWPRVRVRLNETLIFDDQIAGSQQIIYSGKHHDISKIKLVIEYFGKNDEHTMVDELGKITQNQSVTIDSLILNGVNLVDCSLIYQLGYFYFNLNENKKKYYDQHGISTAPSHSLGMFENGKWELEIEFPILPSLCKLSAFYELHEKWPDDKLYNDLYNSIIKLQEVYKIQGT